MEAIASPPPQPLQSSACVPVNYSVPNSTVQDHPPPLPLGPTEDDNKKSVKTIKKLKRRVPKNGSAFLRPSSSSSPSRPSSSSSPLPATGVVLRRRSPKALLGSARRSESSVDAIALPLGMSVAAVVALILETKDRAGGRMSVDHLSMICTSAVQESLVNVFGEKFDCFTRNFEKSFGSTLRTLRLINESHSKRGGQHFSNANIEGSSSPMCLNKEGRTTNSCVEDLESKAVSETFVTRDRFNTIEETTENMQTDSCNLELALHTQMNELPCILPSTSGPEIGQSMVSTFQKSVMEQSRSNDLKTLEISLSMQKLKLKETQLALNFDSNHLERSKLAMGISKASFKAEKFKSQLEDMRHAELLRNCVDCLVAGLLIMSASLLYAAYVFSYQRIAEATESCAPSAKESKSWWIPKPMATFSFGLHVLKCQIQVVSRMLFGVLMILTTAYLLLLRSGTTKQILPGTFLILLLGIACGFAGKLCVDTLGGSGYHWLLYWEALCFLHFISNVFTSALFRILYGPVNVSQVTKGNAVFPYWIRKFMFNAILFLFLPLSCGLLPFASLSEWKDHFSVLVSDHMFTGDWEHQEEL